MIQPDITLAESFDDFGLYMPQSYLKAMSDNHKEAVISVIPLYQAVNPSLSPRFPALIPSKFLCQLSVSLQDSRQRLLDCHSWHLVCSYIGIPADVISPSASGVLVKASAVPVLDLPINASPVSGSVDASPLPGLTNASLAPGSPANWSVVGIDRLLVGPIIL